MKVYQVGIDEIINDYPDNSIILNLDTYTYFLKKEGIEIPDNLTFKDAIEKYYVDYSEEFTKINDDNFDLFGFSNNEETIKLKLNKLLDYKLFYQNYNSDKIDLSDINVAINKIDIDFSNYDKIIYVDGNNGSDDNDGSENSPLKTIYKAETICEVDKKNLIVINSGKYNLINKYNKFNSISTSGIGVKNKNISYVGNGDNVEDVVLFINIDEIRYDSKFLSFFNNLNGNVYNLTFYMSDVKNKAIPNIFLNSNCNVNNCLFVWDSDKIDFVFNTSSKNVIIDKSYFISRKNLKYIDIKSYGYVGVKNSFYNSLFKNVFDYLLKTLDYNDEIILQKFVLNKLI
jgi:hypothetical protein